MLYIQVCVHPKKRIFLHVLGLHTHHSPSLAWFSSGLTVHWIIVCVYARLWAVVIVAWAGAGHQCPE